MQRHHFPSFWFSLLFSSQDCVPMMGCRMAAGTRGPTNGGGRRLSPPGMAAIQLTSCLLSGQVSRLGLLAEPGLILGGSGRPPRRLDQSRCCQA